MIEVFVIDDSSAIRASVGAILQGEGIAVIEASSAEETLSRLRAQPIKPSLFLIDFNMPGMNGIELIRELRKIPGLHHTPMLMMTNESMQERRVEAKGAGATGWLVKPVPAADLLRVIRQLCPVASGRPSK